MRRLMEEFEGCSAMFPELLTNITFSKKDTRTNTRRFTSFDTNFFILRMFYHPRNV
jgi:hypothetical protein